MCNLAKLLNPSKFQFIHLKIEIFIHRVTGRIELMHGFHIIVSSSFGMLITNSNV